MTRWSPLLALLAALSVPSAAAAQTIEKGDIAVGYSLFRLVEGDEDFNLPAGWLVSGAGRLTSWIRIAGEVGGAYKYWSDGDSLWIHTYQAGPRVVFGNSRVNVFGQVLFGGLTVRGADGHDSSSDTRFALEPGGGVDVFLGGRTALRIGVGFPTFFFNEGDLNETINSFRFVTGMVFRFGGH